MTNDDEPSGRPLAITDNLMQKCVDQTLRKDRRFTITSLSYDFPQVCRSVLYSIVTKSLNY